MARVDDPVDRRTVFEGYEFLVVDIEVLLPRHENFPKGSFDVKKPWNGDPAVEGSYYKIQGREIDTLYLHQTAGSVTYGGFEAVRRTATFALSAPGWTKKGDIWAWNGMGRGWPGIGYTYYLPYRPATWKGKTIVYRCWNHDWVTWHSSHNKRSIALVCQGYFKSRHMRSFKPRRGCPDGKPSSAQMVAMQGFVLEYAIDYLGIEPDHIRGHCDSPRPKLACPGDQIEKFVEGVRQGKGSPYLRGPGQEAPLLSNHLTLSTWEERQASLVLLGHYLGNSGKKNNGVDGDPGDLTRLAIEAAEETFGFPVDGYWDDKFDYRVKSQLACNMIGQAEIDELIG